MRKIFITLHTGYCGSEAHEVVEVEDNESHIDAMVQEMAFDNASMYGIDVCEDEDCEDDDCELEHEYNHNIEGSWCDYMPDEHDCYIC